MGTIEIKKILSPVLRRASFSSSPLSSSIRYCRNVRDYDDNSIILNSFRIQQNNNKQQLNNEQSIYQLQQLRYMGTRGSRGHGWYINYRKTDDMNRHLQGEYYDRETLKECQIWNQSIIELGYEQLYIDIVVEPKQQKNDEQQHQNKQNDMKHKYDISTLQGDTKFRLYINIATKIMPETTTNFIQLANEYIGTILYRIEKNVGFCGGDVLTNTGQTGMAANPSLSVSSPYSKSILRYDIQNDPLVLWHIPGTISMIVSKVNCIDSRFMIICSNDNKQHLDGIHRAFGQLTPDSLSQLQVYYNTTLTQKGKPTLYDFVISDVGLVTNDIDQQSKDNNTNDDLKLSPTAIMAAA